MQPKVSVICASYNHQEYVKEAIESVLDQKERNIEVIVVDDGSTDKTADEVAKIKDPRLKLIRLEENRKEHPRNMALSMARGEYIAIQNSDDKWSKEKLIKQLLCFGNKPNLSACFTDVEIIDEFSKRRKNLMLNFQFISQNKSRDAWLRYFFDLGNCLCISSVMMKRERIEEVSGFTPNLFRAADLDLWVRLAARGELYVLKEKLTMMRIISDKNFSAPSAEAKNCSDMELLDIYKNYYKEPILSRLPLIFKNIIPRGKSEVENLGRLALYSWKLTGSHILFGNLIIGELINDKEKRQELTNIFGAGIIKKYLTNRSKIELNLKKSKSISNILQKILRRLWQ